MRILICHQCHGVLLELHMGRQCPYCKTWTYASESKREMEAITEEKEQTDETEEPNISLCSYCHCMTRDVQEKAGIIHCGKCGGLK